MELAVIGGLAATSLYLRFTIEMRKKNKIKNDFKELMEELKLHTKESKTIPEVKKVEFIGNGFLLSVKIPTGLKLKDIEGAQEAIENKFEGLAFINKERFSSTLKIKIITKDIGEYIFEPVKAESYEIYIGKTFDWEDYLIDVNKDAHILIGGATGTGKSFLFGTILTNLIYNSSDEIDLHLGQIIKGELGVFKNCKPVKFISEDLKEIADDLERVAKLIDKRSKHFSSIGIKNLKHYNKHFNDKKIKRIFYIIEELSFFMPSDSDEKDIKELKNRCWDNILTIVKAGRSSGVHLIALTQRTTISNLPSDVKSQMCRISFRQISGIDSKNIIECDDALNLDDRECLCYGTSESMEIIKTPFTDEDFSVLSQYVKEIITPTNSISKSNRLHGIKTIIVSDTPRELPLLETSIKEEIPAEEESKDDIHSSNEKVGKTPTLEEIKEQSKESENKNVLYQRPIKKPKKGMIKIEDT